MAGLRAVIVGTKMTFLVRIVMIFSFICLCDAGLLDRIRSCNNLKDTCNFCYELTENNIDTAHVWMFKGNNGLNEKKLPLPNIHLAMEGYDIFTGNHYEEPDPGRRSQIFEPLEVNEDITHINSFIEYISTDVDCSGEVNVSKMEDWNEFEQVKLFLGNFSEDYAMIRNIPSILNFKRKYDHETLLGEMNCVVSSVKISPFEKPKFNHRFASSLQILNEAAKRPTSQRSRETAFTFFKTYGTHFPLSTDLGAKVLFTKQSPKNLSPTEGSKFSECFKESAKKSMESGNGKTDSTLSKYLSNIVACDSKQKVSGTNTDSIHVIGSLPKQTLNTWSTSAIEDPVVVSVELMKISHLFRQSWLDEIIEKGDQNLNGDLMYKFFEHALYDYCSTILGDDCKMINKKGLASQTPLNDEKTLDHHIMNPMENEPEDVKGLATVTSGIIIQGGYDSNVSKIASAEVISTALAVELPDTPEGMGGHSLAALGSLLYSCGSCAPWKVLYVKRKCYKLDMTKYDSKWESSTGLPYEINNYHSAITVENKIWYFTIDSSKLFVFDGENSSFEEHSLPFKYSISGCFVGNGKNVYYVDTLNNFIYSMIDSKEPESWSRVTVHLTEYYMPSCLLVGIDIVVTGGNGTKQHDKFNCVDVQTYDVRQIANFNQDRIGYSLFILDGRATVAGGVFDHVLNSIEFYDFKTDVWTVNRGRLDFPRAYYGITHYSYPIDDDNIPTLE